MIIVAVGAILFFFTIMLSCWAYRKGYCCCRKSPKEKEKEKPSFKHQDVIQEGGEVIGNYNI